MAETASQHEPTSQRQARQSAPSDQATGSVDIAGNPLLDYQHAVGNQVVQRQIQTQTLPPRLITAQQRTLGNRTVQRLLRLQNAARAQRGGADQAAEAPPLLSPSSIVIARQVHSPQPVAQQGAGRLEVTPFGRYWVTPGGTPIPPGQNAEEISQAAFSQIQATWQAIIDGTGNLVISETDDGTGTSGWGGAYQVHPGFRARVFMQLASLLSQPAGRRLVSEIVHGPHRVVIQPNTNRGPQVGGASAVSNSRHGEHRLQSNGRPGAGAGTVITLDDGLQDDDIVVFDAHRNRIVQPVFIILGHELIHARHNAHGDNRTHLGAFNRHADNQEEEDTIEHNRSPDEMTENDLRLEHGLPERFGHATDDRRFHRR